MEQLTTVSWSLGKVVWKPSLTAGRRSAGKTRGEERRAVRCQSWDCGSPTAKTGTSPSCWCPLLTPCCRARGVKKTSFRFVLLWGRSAGSSGTGVCMRWDGAGRARSSVTPHAPPWRLPHASPRLEECWSGRRLRSWVVTGTKCTTGLLFPLLAKVKCGSGTFHALLLLWEMLLRGSLSPGHTGPHKGHAWLLRWTSVLVLQVSFLVPAGGQKAVDGPQRRGHAGGWWGRGELWGGRCQPPAAEAQVGPHTVAASQRCSSPKWAPPGAPVVFPTLLLSYGGTLASTAHPPVATPGARALKACL